MEEYKVVLRFEDEHSQRAFRYLGKNYSGYAGLKKHYSYYLDDFKEEWKDQYYEIKTSIDLDKGMNRKRLNKWFRDLKRICKALNNTFTNCEVTLLVNGEIEEYESS